MLALMVQTQVFNISSLNMPKYEARKSDVTSDKRSNCSDRFEVAQWFRAVQVELAADVWRKRWKCTVLKLREHRNYGET